MKYIIITAYLKKDKLLDGIELLIVIDQTHPLSMVFTLNLIKTCSLLDEADWNAWSEEYRNIFSVDIAIVLGFELVLQIHFI